VLREHREVSADAAASSQAPGCVYAPRDTTAPDARHKPRIFLLPVARPLHRRTIVTLRRALVSVSPAAFTHAQSV